MDSEGSELHGFVKHSARFDEEMIDEILRTTQGAFILGDAYA